MSLRQLQDRTFVEAAEGVEILAGLLWRGTRWLFKLGVRHARAVFGDGPPIRVLEPSITKRPACAPAPTSAPFTWTFDDEPEAEPELLIRSEDAPLSLDPSPEPRRYDIVREANGTVVLRYRQGSGMASELRTGETILNNPPPEPIRLEEGSRYRRKLIPPGTFNRRDPGVDRP